MVVEVFGVGLNSNVLREEASQGMKIQRGEESRGCKFWGNAIALHLPTFQRRLSNGKN